MASRDLPDIYALARGRKPKGMGIYIRQILTGHGISNIYHLDYGIHNMLWRLVVNEVFKLQ